MLDLSTATDQELQILLLGLHRLRYWNMCQNDARILMKLNGDIKTELGIRCKYRSIERIIYSEE